MSPALGAGLPASSSMETMVMETKIIPSPGAPRGGILLFLREADILAKLQHPSVVRFIEMREHAGQSFLAMEFVETVDVASLAGRLPRDRQIAMYCGVVCQVLDVLEHAHQLSLVHRDVKPSNILVSRNVVGKMGKSGRESLWHRVQGGGDPGAPGLDAWPVPAGREWLETVNRAETGKIKWVGSLLELGTIDSSVPSTGFNQSPRRLNRVVKVERFCPIGGSVALSMTGNRVTLAVASHGVGARGGYRRGDRMPDEVTACYR